MKRTAAAIAIFLGIVAVSLAASSYSHLRHVALNSAPMGVFEHVEVRIMTAGMLDNSDSDIIDAAAFARKLEYRIYAVCGTGLALILVGGALLLLPRQSRHEPNDRPHSPTTRLANG